MATDQKTHAAKMHPEIAEAEKILHAQTVSYDTAKTLLKKLKKKKLFGHARKVVSLARRTAVGLEAQQGLWLAQQHALCTYKDPDLPSDARLDRALTILESHLQTLQQSLQTTTDQETLGIAGAIHKRKWEVTSRKQHLERSLAYYLRGYRQGPDTDNGYTGINAAFILSLLAHQESEEAKKAGTVDASAEARRVHADEIRRDLIKVLPPLLQQPDKAWLQGEWWFYVTIAEAHFGLGAYEDARIWLKKARELPEVPDWERESTAWQLSCLANILDGSHPHIRNKTDSGRTMAPQDAALTVVSEILGPNTAALQRSFTGKVGLALSGGGFRASLYHIGLLAKLAELDVLRHVEVLSCVSGGSIVGAHYYLEIRKLLREKTDGTITRQDYIDIVKRMAGQFLDGVQRNIRTRVAAELTTNWKLIFSKHYTRTNRAGELYETEIFSRVADGEGHHPRWLNELKITPNGEQVDFSPKNHNWRRHAKVPILVLNATTLNTGHNWQFTASWMGEPPADTDSTIDGNDRLRRLYYDDAPVQPVNHRRVRLGDAVAASACVPGLFEPLVLADLYPEQSPHMTVRLVDGGVHDNQGLSALLEQDCTVLLVSDGSGQMDTQDDPSSGLLSVPLRTNTILMARVREAEYREIAARRRASLLRGLLYIHLKDDIPGRRLNWREYNEAPDPDDLLKTNSSMTGYSIPTNMQKLLAGIRTDLDSFSDAEAYALMTSGYRMTEARFPGSIDGIAANITQQPVLWPFLEIEKELNGEKMKGRDFPQLLEVASCRAFKIWKLNATLRLLSKILGAAALGLLIWICWKWWSTSLLSVGMVGTAVATAIATMLVGPTVVRMIQYRKTLSEIGIGFGMGLLGFVAARIHLHIFDPLYLRYGRVRTRTRTATQSQQPMSSMKPSATPHG
jgi:predicted acylesterase/phospholipase RssA